MAIALDKAQAFIISGLNPTQAFTPTGTPRAILVVGSKNFTGGSPTAITYDGQSMTQVTGSPNEKATGESSSVYAWFLDSATLDSASADIVFTASAVTRHITVYSFTAGGEVEIQDTDVTVNSDSLDDPGSDPLVTLQTNGETCWAGIVAHSGKFDGSGITPQSGWTSDQEESYGTATAVAHSYDTIGTSNVSAGYVTTSADDAVMIGILLNEVAAAGPSIPILQNYYRQQD